GEEAEAGAGAEPPRGRPRGDPFASALQVPLPLQVRVQAVARPLLRPEHPQEVATDPLRLLLLPTQTAQFPQFVWETFACRRPISRFAFLRNSYQHFYIEQFCDGLLLCSCWNSYLEEERDYVVCNPATKEWIVLPPVVFPSHDKVWSYPLKVTPFVHLGFDAAVPSHFAVFATPSNVDYDSEEVGIYSSKTGHWTYMQSKWASVDYVDHARSARVFLNGTMHLITLCKSIFTVNVEGKVWREIQMPDYISSDVNDMDSDTDDMSSDVYIGRSQGQLYLWHIDHLHDCQLHIWVLEDYVTGKWTLKHTVKVLELFGRHSRKDDEFYQMFAVHPDCDIIFLTDKNMTLSYDMDNQKVHVISTEGIYGVPYIPCFEELSSAGH
uniref:F-box protein At3g26010-like beta-propeller domain-containing protein n=2 Tax=Triticum urartu TaxID=4572 RepID=A0A8R7K4K7_TRIUA